MNRSGYQTGLSGQMAGDRITASESLAREIRVCALRMVHRAKASHIGSCLSAADLLAVLYGGWLRVDPQRPRDPQRDIFILSKGHAAAALYAVLSLRGFFQQAELDLYCSDGAMLSGHVTHKQVPGVEVSTGSLGHGLSMALGFALAARRRGTRQRVVALLSDGECNEGSVWEAALLAPQTRLGNLVAIVDYNKIQSLGFVKDVIDLEPLAGKLTAFGWHAQEIDGHDHAAIAGALAATETEVGRPSVIVAHTIKGKGVDFMENRLMWHYRSPSDQELADALAQL